MGEWQKVKLGDVCEISSGKASKYTKDQSGMFKVYGSNGVIGSYNEANFYRGYLVGRVGAVGSIQKITEPVWASDNTLTLVINEDLIDFDFMEHLLSTMTLANYATKTAQPLLTQTTLKKIEVELPPLSEQRKIAAILSSVDEAIEKTEAIIEQTEKVKKGLMQQLLTKGIGHTKFKKTEIGEIPEEWEVLEVADVAKTTSGGTPSRNNPEYFNGSIPWIKTGELKEKYIYDTEEKITEEAVKNSSAKLVPKNSVIVAMYGATIGNVSINKIDATTNQACCVVIPQKERLNDEFLYYLLAFWKEKLIKLGAGGAQPNISQQIIKNLLIPMPSLKEQMEIANILAILDKKIQNEKKKFDSLSNLKKGLMQALLTGKVRVKVDNEVMSQ
ncbi:hypothetical protein HPJ93_06830 [Anoxybacillus flavithermus]|uniref:restriction endonuclease subunit S n=1 Tax=Anoxybacillus flavithermus TaxID=33934 RepID=UPI001868AA08|nr:restriction endonuclease subunit S [Anoxybacillus flavithermus]MBE2905298.1 hypothetical protein [Anoxybacillus flavithermus]MBE2921547.1 hypothetical protein [Anoxybacillus flavithermus]